MALLTPWLLAAAGGGDTVRFFATLALMMAAGRFTAEVFDRIGQPPVLGELLVGILLGASLLDVIPTAPGDPVATAIGFLADIGVVILLFEIGLETDLRAMRKVGGSAAAVAITLRWKILLYSGALLVALIGATLAFVSFQAGEFVDQRITQDTIRRELPRARRSTQCSADVSSGGRMLS